MRPEPSNNPWAVNYSAAGNDTLNGGDGNDELHGQGADDVLSGGNDDDELFGEAGDDIIDGGAGINSLTGGAGADVFQFTSSNDESVILDFDLSVDHFRFDVSIADDFGDLTIADDLNGDAHIAVGSVDITLSGVSSASINSSFFDFGLYA